MRSSPPAAMRGCKPVHLLTKPSQGVWCAALFSLYAHVCLSVHSEINSAHTVHLTHVHGLCACWNSYWLSTQVRIAYCYHITNVWTLFYKLCLSEIANTQLQIVWLICVHTVCRVRFSQSVLVWASIGTVLPVIRLPLPLPSSNNSVFIWYISFKIATSIQSLC